jgi:VWFA-related protein
MTCIHLGAILLRMCKPRTSASQLILTAVLLAVPAVPRAQQKAPPERGVELLTVDFAAVTPDGHPVTDLRAEEVTVRIGGRLRTVRSLQMVVAAAPSEDATTDTTTPAPFGTNVNADEGREFVLAIDDDSFRPGRESLLRDAVDILLKRISARDRISVVTMPYGGVKVPFTTDHGRVRTAVSRITGRSPAVETGSELACRTGRTLESLIGFLGTLGIRNEPATIMFITAGLAAPRRDAPVTRAPGMCELRSELFAQVGTAAGAARARFYVIQPGDELDRGTVHRENIAGTGFAGSDNPIEGIEHLAGVTGGKMLQLTNSAETALGRVARETAAHYVAAVEPATNDRSGRSQQLEVKVKRPGVELRTRPHITFAKPEPSLGTVGGLSPREMLAVLDVFRDLPLRATGFAALEADGQSLRIMTIAEPAEPGVKLGTLVAALFDADGKLVSHWSATSAELQRTPIIGAMPAAPGAYRLRVAAIDTTGRSGTADYEVTAEVAKTGPLKLSSLILGLSREGGFVPRLQFTEEPVAIGYVEMYGAAAGARVTATLELAATLNGPALVSLPLAIQGVGENRYVAKGALPIGAVPPGDYIVRALVALEGHPMTRVVRTLRKAIVAR